MNAFKKIEAAISALEELTGLSISIIDCGGLFHDLKGGPLFPAHRQTHQKNAVCKAGFCHKCIAHCRHEMLGEAQNRKDAYFVHKCWKGLSEIVVPLRKEKMLLGLLYAGIWSERGRKPTASFPPELPGSFVKEYAKLAVLDPEKARSTGLALSLFASGIVAELEKVIFTNEVQPDRKTLIREYVFKHAAKSPSLSGLAQTLKLSPSRASHLVGELFGKSLEELITEERMGRAINLLGSTNMPLGLVAELAGFPDHSSFGRMFKRLESCSPGDFRRRQLGRGNA